MIEADRYQGATVLVAGAMLGCGFREHAPWGVRQGGLEGLDDIALTLTLQQQDKIAALEAARSPYLPVAGP